MRAKKDEFGRTFSSVLDLTTIRLGMAVDQFEGTDDNHLDITGVFLYGNLPEEITLNSPRSEK